MQFRAACRRLRIRHVSSSRAEEQVRKRKREGGKSGVWRVYIAATPQRQRLRCCVHFLHQ